MSADYLRPDTLGAALDAAAARRVRIAAGCTDLFAMTDRAALEIASDSPVLDITGIAELKGIAATEQGLRIGATTTWSEIVAAPLPPAFDGLKAAAREVGSVQIQNAGTLAGNLCNASPAADGVPPLLTLSAEVEIAHRDGRRTLPLSAFLTGPRRTALRPGEIATALHVPEAAMAGRSAFQKLGARRYLVISIAMVAVRLVEAAGRVAEAAVSVGACSAVATRLPELEAALTGAPVDAALPARVTESLVGPSLSPIDDVRGDAAYRTHAATVLVRRALATLAEAPREAAA